jgi:multidrug efflux system membrane fusion protein
MAAMPGIRTLVRAWIALSVVALGSAGCSVDGRPLAGPPADTAAAPKPAPAVSVTAVPVVQKAMPIAIDVVGAAEAFSTVAVHAQITGELTSVNFHDGDDVAKGQELFTLDRRPLEAALQQARANLDRDVAQLANARAQLKRYQDLSERGIATREQLDTSQTMVTALEATTQADRAAADNAVVQLAYATVSAPIAGRTGKLLVSVGNLVRANDATPLVVINQVSPIYVAFGVPDTQFAELKRYMARGSLRVEAHPSDSNGAPSVGRLTFFDNAVDQSTGTIAVRATFPNDDRRLWPGQFVNVTVILDTDPSALVVPSSAVQDSQKGAVIFVVGDDNTVAVRPIQLARAAGSETVVASGVKPGEMVVTDGQIRLTAGSKVTLRGAAPVAAAKAP